ncbi:MAG: 1-acyl-sn-glycerol-3-phosphate acyltransferase [Deltaproteobacteria bacterium]|nr:1-acyl-sn-glycerol-3-phosphate acyltransferase [Deltaproteobacteria bacterium]
MTSAMVGTAIKYLFLGLGIILAYEIVRALLVSSLKGKLNRSVKDFIEKNRIRLDKYKFMHKVVVKHELMNDPDIHKEIISHAKEKNLTIYEVEGRVEGYIDEIVPAFNLLSYYKIGYWVANFILNLIYEVVIDRENAEKLKRLPDNSVIVFVMNHRSNIDYILVAFMLARQISLSYAVGEWARVWPLEYIFKSFGAYFIRRRFREKLYHLVLEKYVQLISIQGVTQGIFIEGGLSRDGNFRQTKTGILNYIIGVQKDPRFDRDLVFVPVAINYDWILEDSSLIQEWKVGKKKSGFGDHLASLARLVGKGPFLLFINLFRYLSGRLKHFMLERYERLSRIQELADRLRVRIGEAMPVTPVCLVSQALLSFDRESVSLNELVAKVSSMREQLKKMSARIVLGRAFEGSMESYSRLKSEEDDRRRELVSFEEDFLASQEVGETVRTAVSLLKRRKVISLRKGEVKINTKRAALLEFYSNSLSQLIA